MASVQALLKAIKVVPTQAIPETVNAFLMATSTSPSELFSSLEAIISQMLKDNEVLEVEDEYLKSIVLAILHLFKVDGLNEQMLSKMIWGLGIPFLQKSKLSLTSFQTIVAQFLVETIAHKKSWDYARVSLVPYLLKSMEVILGNQQYIGNGSDVNAIQSKISSLNLMDEDRSYKYGLLKFHVVCHLAGLLILEASNNINESETGSTIIKDFLNDVILKFFQPMLSVISRTTDDLQRQCVIRVFLPPALRGIQNLDWNINKYLVESLQKELWENIKFLFSQASSQRQDAYFALNVSAEFLLCSCDKKVRDNDNVFPCSNICSGIDFWANIKSGLVDDDPLTRKRAIHVLKATLKDMLTPVNSNNQDHRPLKSQKKNSSGKSTTRRDRYADIEARSLGLWDCEVERWKAFFLLYDMLDEYGTHLVEAAWSNQLTVLIPTLCGKDLDHEPLSEKQQPESKFNLQDLATSIWWITALWERGFKHDNPQVRRLTLQSFLELNWENVSSLGNVVPNEFLLGPLFSVLNDPIHHKDFGAKGVYSSTVANAASTFFNIYSKSLAKRDHENFILKMLGRLSSKGFCRPGFMTLMMCLEATASSYQPSKAEDSNGYNIGSGPLNGDSMGILDCLGVLVENSKKHFNPSYRLKTCLHLLRVVKHLVEVAEVTFDKFVWFLSVFPQEFIINEGPLHKHVCEWIQSSTSFCKTHFQQWLREGLYEKADMFVRPPTSASVVIVSDEEVKCWQQCAEKWARVVSLGFLNENNATELMMFVHRHACNIYQRAYSSTCVPEKLLLLLDSMLKMFSSLSKKCKTTHFYASIPKGMEDEFKAMDVSHELYFCTDIVPRHLQQIVSSNMDEFIAHAERASSVFWNYDFRDRGPLPSSVTGKLGGPSQRRLPEKVASDVLKGVIAVEVLADCIAYLCNHGEKVPDSAMLFIWDFAYKAAKGRKAMEEIEGEIQLGLFEALAHLLRALALSINPDVMSLVGNMIFFEVGKDKIIDTTVFSLLENINGLLHSCTLARSRKAALLKEKWCCLEALLSIPKCKVNATIKDDDSATSPSVLKSVLLDAVSSLESVGEDNILPLLRCVRWLMHWNTLHHMCTLEIAGTKTGMEVAWALVRAAWAAVADSNKRRVSSIAAFLSSIFHSNVFSDVAMHHCDGDVGPLKWLFCRLLEQSSKSPRTMRLMSMHVAGLWLNYPSILQYYINEVKQLYLHGGESIDEELDGQISENLMAAKEYGMLMQSLDPELVEEFRNSELYARVTIAVLIHKLAELVELDNVSCQPEKKQDVFIAATFGRNLIINLLNSLATDPELSKELYKKKSAIHRRKIRAWQMACILSRFVDESIVNVVMGLLQKCLLRNNLPSVRQYAEIFGILLCLRFPVLVKENVVPCLADYNMKAQTLASYVFISINVVMHATPVSVQQMLVEDVVPAVFPYFTTHHHPLRSFSQILMYEVLHNILKIHPSLEVDKTRSFEKRCLESLVLFLDENSECKRIRVAVNKFLASFDPLSASTPRGIFSLRCGGEEDPSKPLEDIPFECAPVAVMDKVSEFLNEVREDLRQSMAVDAIMLKSEEICDSTSIPQHSSQSLCSGQTNPTDFQRKIASLRFIETSPSNNGMIMDHNGMILSEMEVEEDLLQTTIHSRVEDLVKMRGNRQDLIVVATLLGRIPNLAGLARTCEVFKASTLVLPDAAVTQDKQFKMISVTAEMWVPIKEVPEANLHEFLLLKSKEGYSLVGLEQTANSVSLENYTFPKKTVLVLGREKEGIPIDIIQCLDSCVEIPQLGVVRSLNVHVSGAIAVWEYTRQYLHKN